MYRGVRVCVCVTCIIRVCTCIYIHVLVSLGGAESAVHQWLQDVMLILVLLTQHNLFTVSGRRLGTKLHIQVCVWGGREGGGGECMYTNLSSQDPLSLFWEGSGLID